MRIMLPINSGDRPMSAAANRRKGRKQARVISVLADRVFVRLTHSGEVLNIINPPEALRREGAKCWVGYQDRIPFLETWETA